MHTRGFCLVCCTEQCPTTDLTSAQICPPPWLLDVLYACLASHLVIQISLQDGSLSVAGEFLPTNQSANLVSEARTCGGSGE